MNTETEKNELVRIIDWQSTTYYGTRIVIVQDNDPRSNLCGQIAWEVEETRLTPLLDDELEGLGDDMHAHALEQARSWRAERDRRQMETDTDDSENVAARIARL